MTSAWLRSQAETDLIATARYYRSAGGDALGERFFDSALAAIRSLRRGPYMGSTAIGEMCHIPGLRSRSVKKFPVGWYYFVADRLLDVVRLLSDVRDLPPLFADMEAP